MPAPLIKLYSRSPRRCHSKTFRLCGAKHGHKQPRQPNSPPRTNSRQFPPTSCFRVPGFCEVHRLVSVPRCGGGGASDVGWTGVVAAAGRWTGLNCPHELDAVSDVLPISTQWPWHASSSCYLFKSVTGEQNLPM